MTKLADELEALAKDGWQDIANAPVNTPVRVKAGNMTFIARIVLGASMTSDEQECDQWQAEHEGEHPPCWSGGACWESNEDEAMSLQPTHWQPIAALHQPDAVPGDLVERLLGHCADKDGCLEAAAAIQSLTAERDAALARVVEAGRIYQALVNLQDHAKGVEKAFKDRLGTRKNPTWFAVNALQDFVGFVGMWEECNHARALLEGSKP